MTRLHPAAALLGAVLLVAGPALGAATISIINLDDANEGFNDTTPWTPTGGNPATTVGQARLNAFQHAADIWGGIVESGVVIEIEAEMHALTCGATGAVLGYAGATTVHYNFTGAPYLETYYPQALANAIRGFDLNPLNGDISATFSTSLNGNVGCLGGTTWYYGLDGNPPAGTIDFVTVVLHELGHGLGFQTFADVTTGARLGDRNDGFLHMLEDPTATPSELAAMSDAQRAAAFTNDPNLRWGHGDATYMANQVPLVGGMNGVHPRMHAPGAVAVGSSVSHWSTDVSPDELMEPSYAGAQHDPSLAKFLLKDIGWPTDASVAVTFSNLSAVPGDGRVQVSWSYTSDEPLAGFHVYRAETGKAGEVQLTDGRLLDRGARTYVDAAPPAGASLLYTVAAIRPDGSEIRSTAVPATTAAALLTLAQNRPNPFNPSTEIDFSVDRDAAVTLRVFDLAGRLVRTLVDERLPAGGHTALWDGRDDGGRRAPSGAYVYRLDAGRGGLVGRMTLLK
jgi:hypothetical protein